MGLSPKPGARAGAGRLAAGVVGGVNGVMQGNPQAQQGFSGVVLALFFKIQLCGRHVR